MFSTFKQRFFLGVYIFLLLSIPVGAFLVSEYRTNLTSKASEIKKTLPITSPPPLSSNQNPISLPRETLGSKVAVTSSPSPEPSTTTATSFGPTLSLKVALEGRPADNQKTRLFVGILEGLATSSPKFLLSFTVNLPPSGEYTNISLAGLTIGNRYSALLKGSAQIASASAFIMSPTVSSLNNSQAINLLSGDLNDDNTINSADYSVAQKAVVVWNENADLNKDGVVNALDLAIITKNFGKTGDTGAWVSPVPLATPSAELTPANPPIGGPENSSAGYWIWVPQTSTP